ncbi:DUF5753 domain-containing protein [Pseudonocardia sp. HH130630-07]|uniref:DUF5753 domain-containing protein n=1 Tax=Pseudonocardia sp. HH130630-07 TaxID=1690815 RepID=UPI0009F5BF6C|nr:DUF5753 domain-containing protein [Pseudonocardia sp. HH130630-07]
MQAGLTGRQLAESLSWPQSKVSKLETARQAPGAADIRAWTRVTDSESHTGDLLAALEDLDARHAQWQRVLRPGLRPHQAGLSDLDARTRRFRVFEATVVPGLLQTAGYARARLAQGVALHGATDDVDLAVHTRMARQELLYDPGKRFHFVVTEAALRLRLAAPQVMLAQLDRLMTLSTLPNVRLGVIGSQAPYLVGPWHGFWLRDDDRVLVETFSAELCLTHSREIELYGALFGRFAALAGYGRAAREILFAVAEDVATEVPRTED